MGQELSRTLLSERVRRGRNLSGNSHNSLTSCAIIGDAPYNSQMELLITPPSPNPQRRHFLGLASALAGASALGLSACATVIPKKPVVGLVLGAGAARGFAHIGVIKALEAQGISPNLVLGSSAGSVIASLYASGLSGNDLNRIALTLDEAAIADWGLPFAGRFGGLIKGDALQAMINREVKNRPIEQMRMPLGVVATDLQSGKGVLFRRGDTGMAVRASCSIPGVFQPTTIQGREYVDGGLVAPVPVQYARQMGATVVIAVSISNEPGQQNASGTLGVLQQTISIMQQSINSYELQGADIVIQPKLQQMGGADFKARSAAILAGEIATQEKMAQIKALISA